MDRNRLLALGVLAATLPACSHQIESATPAPGAALPQIVCGEQVTKVLTLSGDKFSPVVFEALTDGFRVILPEITLTRERNLDGSAATGPAVRIPDDPANPAASRVKWQSQMRMTFEVFPDLGLAPGVYRISVRNASGQSASVGNALAVVPRPSVTTVVPDLLCTEQFQTTVTLNGMAFLKIGGTLPAVAIGPVTYAPLEALGCSAIAGPVVAELCTGLRVAIPQGDLDAVAPETLSPHDVVVTNPMPAECRSTEPKRLTTVPRPRVAKIEADLACTEQYANGMVVTGTDFFGVAGALPAVRIGPRTYAPAAEGCTVLTGFDEEVQRCTVLRLTVPQGDLDPGVHRVEVGNPMPVECRSTDAVDLLVVPRPTVTDVEPDLVCREQLTNEVKVKGTDFLTVDGVSPEVSIGSQTFSGASVVPSPAGCVPVPGLRETVQRCDELTVTIPAGALAAGPNPVTVRNPVPAQCQSTDAFNLVAVDRPMVTGLSRPAVCVAQGPQTLVVQGSGFFQIGTETPTVTLGSRTYPTTPMSCTAVGGLPSAQVCSELSITVAQGDLPPGEYALTVTNPSPAACQSTDSVTVQVTSPPTGVEVVGIDPRLCEGGGILTISGMGFQPGAVATLTLGGVSVDAFMNTVSADGTQLVATFGHVTPSFERYTLTVRNPDGCSATASNTVQVTRGIFAFFVDPPVVYNGINTKITILATGVGLGGPTEVRLVGAQNTITYSGTEIDWGGNETPPRPQRVRVVVERDTPAGTYSVGITDGTGCFAFLPDGLVVTAETRLALTGITPPFGAQDEDTAVIVTAKATASLAAGEVNFRSLPRGYLSPTGTGAGTATEIRAVSFVNETRLTAVAPNRSSALAAGDYDVIVVNPTGEVGVLLAAYRVTGLPPPIVDSVSPGTLRTNPTPQTAFVNGRNFRQPAVRFTCRAPGTTTDVLPTVTVQGTPTDTQIQVNVDMAMLSAGMICIVRVTNGDDGSFFDFSAVTVANPSQGANALDFRPGPLLVAARRAPAAAAARVTRTARFIYAIGGDAGTAAGALGTVEAATVGLFGDLGSWFTIPIPLTKGNPASGAGPTTPTARTLAGAARVGGFLYLVGGHDGSAPTREVLRAQILVPEESPVMGDPDISVDEDSEDPGQGLASGLWSYRVSAVLEDNQAHNPGGETLTSEPLLVRVPSLEFPVILRVCWTPPVRPAGVAVRVYRVYRTRQGGEAPGNERLLAECPGAAGCTSPPPRCYDDVIRDPAQFADPNRSPLPLGSTGVWHEVPALGVARASAGVAAAPLSAGAAIYAVGGTSDGTAGLASYEFLVVGADGSVPPGAMWTSGGTNVLGAGRFQLQLASANSVNAPRTGSDVWLYALAGRTQAGAVDAVSAAKVNAADGTLGTWDEGVKDDGARAGQAAAVSFNFIFQVGGSGGAPSNDAVQAEICGPDVGGACSGTPAPPQVFNWNQAPAANNPRRRFLAGNTVQSAFWYLIGGQTDTEAASRTTDLSVFGGQP